MRLSCGDHSFPLVPHETVLDIVAALGFDGLNLVLWGNRSHVRPDAIRADVAGWAGRLEERIRGRGLEIADLVCIPWTDYETLAVNHPDVAERERSRAFFGDMLDFAVRLGVPGLTLLPGIDWPDEPHEASLARALGELEPRLAEARDRGVPLSIEPHVGSVCEKPGDAAWLCETLPGLQLTLDYTHFVSLGFAESEVDPLVPHTRHFHARGGANGRLQTSLAENSIDYERIIDLLARSGYDGHIAVEYVWVEVEGMAAVDVLSETVMMRDRLLAKLAGSPWTYPEFARIT